jgi:glycosyltransferase involved in cell wall biosynthesis
LDTGLRAAADLAGLLSKTDTVELVIAGRVDERTVRNLQGKSSVPLRFMGVIAREGIPELDRSAHVLFSAEINAPCPNAVVEALACGLPVLGFDTGALRELIGEEAGRLAPYGGNPWKLDPPDVQALVEPALEILGDQARFRSAARARAEAALGVDTMVENYLKVLLER